MKMKKLINTIFLVIFFFTTTKSIYSQITSDSLGCVPLLSKFTSPFPDIKKPIWDFADGASSDKLNPSHVFSNPGEYIVKLYDDKTLKATKKIIVYKDVEVIIDQDANQGCAPFSINFSNKSKKDDAIKYIGFLWDFGDGVSGTNENQVHTYTDIGTFNVTLNITTNIPQCNATKTFQNAVKIDQKINVNFKIDSIVPACSIPTKVYYSLTGPIDTSLIYKWNFGNGESSNNPKPGPVTYTKAGIVTTSLTVDNKKGCISKIERLVNINGFSGNLNIKIKDTICFDQIFYIVNNTNFSKYLWNFGNGANQVTTNLKTPIDIKYTSSGSTQIKLTVTNSLGCMKDTVFNIFVEKPEVPFTCDPMIICKLPNEVIFTAVNKNLGKYIWNGEEGGSTFVAKFEYIERDTFYYNEPDSFELILQTVSKNGCQSKYSKKIATSLPNAQFTLDNFEGLAPFTLNVEDKSESPCPIVKWIYTWGDGTTSVYDSITIKSASHIYDKVGKYYINLSIENEKGCVDMHYGAWINVEKMPEIDLPTCSGSGTRPIFCFGDTIRLITNIVQNKSTAIHFNLGNNVSHCESNTEVIHILNDKPGTENLFLSIETGGTFTDVYATAPIKIFGAKSVINYEISCTEKYKVDFKNMSINATSSYWKLDGEVITDLNFSRQFSGPGKHKIQLCSINDVDPCGEHCTEETFELQDPKAVIDTKSVWCKKATNILSSKNSKDATVGCNMGYTWSFSKSAKFASIVTEADSAEAVLGPGIHTISLEVRDVNGCRDTATKQIKVLELEADYTYSFTELCNPINATFKDNSLHDTIIKNYSWNFAPDVNNPIVSKTFDNIQDSVLISLSIEDALGCKSTKEKYFKVYKPTSSVKYDPIICEANGINFTATDFTEKGSKLKYDWQYNSNQVSTKNNLQLSGFKPGIHTVYLTITEEKTGCINEYINTFRVIQKPKAVIADLEDSIFCYPKSIQFFGNKSTFDQQDQLSYQWSFGNNRSSSKMDPIETFNKGEFNIKLIAKSAYQCNDTTTKKIKLIGPEGEMKANKNKVCIGEPITFTVINQKDVTSYYWDFGQGETKANTSPVTQKYDFYPSSGKTFASLVLESSEKGCETVLNLPIELYEAEAKFESDSSTCENSISLKNISLGKNKYTWQVAGNTTSTDTNFVFKPTKSGSYPINLIIKNTDFGCIDTFKKTIVFLEPPVLNVSGATLCDDQIYSFIKDPNIKEYIFDPSGLFKEDGNKYNATISSSQNFYIKAIAKNGCTKEENFTLTHNEANEIDTSFYLPLCDEISKVKIPITIAKTDSVFWSFSNGSYKDLLDCNNCPTPGLKEKIEGTLKAKVIDYNLCKATNFIFEIDIPQIEIPNYFSPNDDGENELFRPVVLNDKSRNYFKIIQLNIHNRWGIEVYSSDKPWDGKINGLPASEEVYYYTMTFGTDSGCLESVKGNLTLAR
jgi:gliding motility-associated-like protein